VPLETIPIASAFWLAIAEAPASQVASASSYRCPENIFGLAIIKSKRELIKIQRQIFLAHIVIVADDAALNQRPERFHIVRVNDAAHVLALLVANGFVREFLPARKVLIARMLIGRDQLHVVLVHYVMDEATQRRHISAFDHLADHASLAADRADHRSLIAGSANVMSLICVAIFVFPTHVGFVDFDDAHKLAKFWIGESGAQPMADEPCGTIRTGTDHPVYLQCADSFLASQHQVEHLEPDQQLVIRVLENRVDGNREPIGCALGFPAICALPVEGARLARVHLFVAASRTADDATRPTLIAEIRLAGIFIGKQPVESRKGQLFNEFRFVFCLIVLGHETNIAIPTPLVKGCIIA
jgi:hypothetical protein